MWTNHHMKVPRHLRSQRDTPQRDDHENDPWSKCCLVSVTMEIRSRWSQTKSHARDHKARTPTGSDWISPQWSKWSWFIRTSVPCGRIWTGNDLSGSEVMHKINRSHTRSVGLEISTKTGGRRLGPADLKQVANCYVRRSDRSGFSKGNQIWI